VKILFDQGTSAPLRKHLTGHEVSTAFELGWSQLTNGALIEAAENAGFEVPITTDQNLRYQQNLQMRKLAIIVLMGTSWPKIQLRLGAIQDALANIQARTYLEIALINTRQQLNSWLEPHLETSGYFSGASKIAKLKSTSSAGQQRWSGDSSLTSRISLTFASLNQG